MDRTWSTGLVVAMILLSGCPGSPADTTPSEFGESAATATPETPAETPTPTDTTPSPTPTPELNASKIPALAELSYTDGRQLNLTALVRSKVDFLRSSDGYVVRSNVTFDPPSQGIAEGRTAERRVDMRGKRASSHVVFRLTNGSTVRQRAFFIRGSTAYQVDRNGAVQNSTFSSSFENSTAPLFSRDSVLQLAGPVNFTGTNQRIWSGAPVYDFTATDFSESAAEDRVVRLYGRNATLVAANMTTTIDGIVTRLDVHYTIPRNNSTQTVRAAFRTTRVGQVSVPKPDWMTED